MKIKTPWHKQKINNWALCSHIDLSPLKTHFLVQFFFHHNPATPKHKHNRQRLKNPAWNYRKELSSRLDHIQLSTITKVLFNPSE